MMTRNKTNKVRALLAAMVWIAGSPVPAFAQERPGGGKESPNAPELIQGQAEVSVDALPLQVLGTAEIRDVSQRGISRIDCDREGNLFVSALPLSGERKPAGVMRISKDGGKLTSFLLGDIPELQNLKGTRPPRSFNFSLTPGGDVDLIVAIPGATTDAGLQFAIAVFAGEGKFRKLVRLAAPYYPEQVVPLASGQWLIAGQKLVKNKAKKFIALFSESGEVIREVETGEDDGAATGAAVSTKLNMRRGFARQEADGNIYVLASINDRVMQVYSPYGEILNRVSLQWPHGAEAAGAFMASGSVAVESITAIDCAKVDRSIQDCPSEPTEVPQSKRTILIFSVSTGELVRKYDAPWSLGRFACYTPDGVAFIRSEERSKNLNLILAGTR